MPKKKEIGYASLGNVSIPFDGDLFTEPNAKLAEDELDSVLKGDDFELSGFDNESDEKVPNRGSDDDGLEEYPAQVNAVVGVTVDGIGAVLADQAGPAPDDNALPL